MLDSLSVPRRSYDFEDYINIVRRNFGWLIAPTFAGLVIATVVAYTLQDTYVSSALIRVTPQQISPELVQSVTSQDVADRINGMAQSILSRTTLTNLITTYGLYKKELASEPMEDVVEKMHRAIGIYAAGGSSMSGGSNNNKFLPAMQISFAYSDKYTAQRVCADLVNRFMNLSTSDVAASQEEANQFLTSEWQTAKQRLDEIEKKLSDFRAQHAGRLPEQMDTNLREMDALNNRLSVLSEQANRINEVRMELQNELHLAKERLTAAGYHNAQAQWQNQKVAELDRQIEGMKDKLSALRERFTEAYPEVQDAKDELARLQKERDNAAKEKPPKVVDTNVDNPVLNRDRLDAQENVDRINTQLQANAMEAAQNSREMAAVNGQLHAYQSRLGMPTDEKEYSDLIQDRDLAKQRFIDLDGKRGKSGISIDMERSKQGETLELLDAASLPTQPTTASKRQMMLPTGAALGLVAGVIIVAIRELKDTSLKNLKDARLYTQLPILGSVPLLENDIVVQRRKQVMWVGWATATIAGLAVMAGTVAHYYLSKG